MLGTNGGVIQLVEDVVHHDMEVVAVKLDTLREDHANLLDHLGQRLRTNLPLVPHTGLRILHQDVVPLVDIS